MPQTNVWLADPKIPLDVLSCFDPLGNAVHTALSFDVLGEDVLITGAGPIGIMAATSPNMPAPVLWSLPM
jgi:threonine 3-dehydrogenase